MLPDPAPVPGSPSVPPFAGWQDLAVALLAVLVVALALLALGVLATAFRRSSPEWQAELDARSRPRTPTAGPLPLRSPAGREDGGEGSRVGPAGAG
ncbi:hypothetical protein JKP75_10125 [Blastococcus sp. TML/M2B]|uniref:hypothetical protein n=1 Tax=unclassified Blastococcus TaxID=2619396 RepID=UPI00190D3B15|nr:MULTISPECIES: hypothetical protein [unclassified Blastococcus]MBN1092884.1 hypothetical protein [Blastococcus sp. TML/M2B]MBN1097007.1 hypothetical protein [Blastococcus sp. TML/C7B]